jgi:hypothetical protein
MASVNQARAVATVDRVIGTFESQGSGALKTLKSEELGAFFDFVGGAELSSLAGGAQKLSPLQRRAIAVWRRIVQETNEARLKPGRVPEIPPDIVTVVGEHIWLPADTNLLRSPLPKPNSKWTAPDGRVLELGEQLGQGSFSRVYALKGTNKVVKIFPYKLEVDTVALMDEARALNVSREEMELIKTPLVSSSGIEVAEDTYSGAQLLKDEKILQLDVEKPGKDVNYLIQDRFETIPNQQILGNRCGLESQVWCGWK